jgi:HlyD family secretion protein
MASYFPRTTTACLLLLGCLGCSLGCRPQPEPPRLDRATTSPPPTVVAQGQILPAGGIIRLLAQPGDLVSDMRVRVGDEVQKGMLLAAMRSSELQAAQIASLRQQREQAETTHQSAVDAAEQRLAAAQLRLAQLQSQAALLERQQDLLDLGAAQVEAARGVLDRLEKIAENPATAGFVGKLEIERQKIQVREAELNYRQQEIVREQSIEELDWAQQLAERDVQAAEKQLAAAQQSSAVKVLELQLAAAKIQAQTGELVAPRDGTILAIHVSEGESAVQMPVIELADLSRLVCEVEINEIDAARVAPGQLASIRSRAWDQPLRGVVSRKYALVGRPQLRPLDPLAPADYRTVTATIEVDPDATPAARNWLQLQVEVTIDTTSSP